MAYQNGKTYYVIPLCATGDAAYNQKILNKQVQPLALNIRGTGEHYNNRNVNVYSLDWSTDMQWYLEVPRDAGYARFHCKGNPEYGLDYYYGSSNPGNCDIYKIIGNEEDSKINFRTINASENLYRIQCYRNNADNDLYLTATGTSNGADVRWQPLDSSKAAYQTWWLVPIENVSANTPSTPTVPTTPNEIKDQEFFVKAYGTNLNLNVYGTDTVANARNVNVYAKENCLAQKWIAKQTSAGPKLFTSINQAYALNINTADNNCTMYTASGNDTDSVLAFEEVADMLYRIKMNNHNKYLRVDPGATSGSNVYWVSDINSATYWEFIPEDVMFPATSGEAIYFRKHNTNKYLGVDSNNKIVPVTPDIAKKWKIVESNGKNIICDYNNPESKMGVAENGVDPIMTEQDTSVFAVRENNGTIKICYEDSSTYSVRSNLMKMLTSLFDKLGFSSETTDTYDEQSTTSDTLPSTSSVVPENLKNKYVRIKHKNSGKYLTFRDSLHPIGYGNVVKLENTMNSMRQVWKVTQYDDELYCITPYNNPNYSLEIETSFNNCVCSNSGMYVQNNRAISIETRENGKYYLKFPLQNKYLCEHPRENSFYITGVENIENSIYDEWEITEHINYLTYPCIKMNITQRHDGLTSHYDNPAREPKDYPIDENCGSTGRSMMYCPCDEMEVVRVRGVVGGTDDPTKTNAIWLRSTTPVTTPSGQHYIVMMVIHPEDDDLSTIAIGRKYKRGESMFREGQDGVSTGNHFHISVGTGNIDSNYRGCVQRVVSYGNLVNITEGTPYIMVLKTTGTTLLPDEAFFVNTKFTEVLNKNNYSFDETTATNYFT